MEGIQPEIYVDGKRYERLTIDDLDNDGVTNLIGRIIKEAVDDYKCAYKKKHSGTLTELEHFFHSEYFNLLTRLNGNVVMKMAREEAEKEIEEEAKLKEEKATKRKKRKKRNARTRL